MEIGKKLGFNFRLSDAFDISFKHLAIEFYMDDDNKIITIDLE
jgi:hypothetical protein